jgi:hypothetical protein
MLLEVEDSSRFLKCLFRLLRSPKGLLPGVRQRQGAKPAHARPERERDEGQKDPSAYGPHPSCCQASSRASRSACTASRRAHSIRMRAAGVLGWRSSNSQLFATCRMRCSVRVIAPTGSTRHSVDSELASPRPPPWRAAVAQYEPEDKDEDDAQQDERDQNHDSPPLRRRALGLLDQPVAPRALVHDLVAAAGAAHEGGLCLDAAARAAGWARHRSTIPIAVSPRIATTQSTALSISTVLMPSPRV